MYSKMIRNGYYMIKEWYDKPLKYCPYGSCGAMIRKDGTIFLKSYSTIVCSIDPQGWLECGGTYSATTRKHIGAFMKEYGEGASYYHAKECYLTNTRYNVKTGEIEKLT